MHCVLFDEHIHLEEQYVFIKDLQNKHVFINSSLGEAQIERAEAARVEAKGLVGRSEARPTKKSKSNEGVGRW